MLIPITATVQTLEEAIVASTGGAAKLNAIYSARPYPGVGSYVVDFQASGAVTVHYSTVPGIDATVADSNNIAATTGRAVFTLQNLKQMTLIASSPASIWININFLP